MKQALRAGVSGLAFLALTVTPGAQSSLTPTSGEWRSYPGELRNQHYSALSQVAAGDFQELEVAWRFKTDNLGPHPEFKLEGTPLLVRGVLYTTAGTRRSGRGRCGSTVTSQSAKPPIRRA